MKRLLFVLLIPFVLFAAENPDVPFRDLIAKQEEVVLTDGASWFRFRQDGTFSSGPHGISGRRLTGTWTGGGNPAEILVTAQQGWVNGLSALDDYRRIKFVIYSGHIEPPKPGEFGFGGEFKGFFKGYWLIDEFTKVAVRRPPTVPMAPTPAP